MTINNKKTSTKNEQINENPAYVNTLLFYVNGQHVVEHQAQPEWTLLWYLRNSKLIFPYSYTVFITQNQMCITRSYEFLLFMVQLKYTVIYLKYIFNRCSYL